jgi:geranylgeranyl diphosphate synthase type II
MNLQRCGELAHDSRDMAGTRRSSVQRELDRFASDGLRRTRRHSADVREMWVQLARASHGGKRLRSALLLASYRCYGGQDEFVASRVGAALELLHTAFLMHDDVIDKDLTRRGSKNISGDFVDRALTRGACADGASSVGVAAGVLAGDLALMKAARLMALCGADPVTTRGLLDLLDNTVEVTVAGEVDDVVMSGCVAPKPSLDQVIAIAENKTAGYSFQFPLQAGALLAGAPNTVIDQLAEVGRLAGVGYQLVDDLRGVFGDESSTGKSVLGDLREGKQTALIVHARGTSAWDRVSPHIGNPALTAEQAATARALLESCGSRRFVEELAEDYLTRAVSTAEQVGLEPTLLGEIARLAERILESAA